MLRWAEGVRRPQALAWAAAWGGTLALAGWILLLTPGWLAAAAVGGILWAALARGVGPAWRWSVAASFALAVSIGAWYQLRLGEGARNWEQVRFAAETRAGAEVKKGLDDIFDRDTLAAAEAGRAVEGAKGASTALFERMEAIRRERKVTALAVYEPDGSPLVWAGEHRGTVPDSVRAGLRFSSYSAGPLFGYVYFTSRLAGGRVAVAAELLEAHVEVGEGTPPYAQTFASRYGVAPRFTTPEFAPQDSAWDWTGYQGRILSVVFATLTQETWRARVVLSGRWGVAAAWLLIVVLLASAWARGDRTWGLPLAAVAGALFFVPWEAMGAPGDLFSPLGFVLRLPGDPTLGQLLIVLAALAVWLLSRSRSLPLADRVPLAARVVLAGAALVGAVALVRASAAAGALAANPAGGLALVAATALLIALPLRALLGEGEGRESPRRRGELVALAAVLSAVLGAAVVLWWRPGRELPLWTAALWAIPFAFAAAGVGRRGAGRGALLPWALAGWIAGSAALPNLWLMHQNARLSEAERDLGRLGMQADPFLDFLLRQFAERVLFFAAEGRQGVSLLYQSWVESGLAKEGYEARLTLWNQESPSAELRLSDAQIPAERVTEVLRAARQAEEPTVQRFTDSDHLHYLLAVTLPGGQTVSVAVPPRRNLGRSTALARFLDPAEETSAGNTIALSLHPAAGRPALPPGGMRWDRADSGWRSEAAVRYPGGPMHAHLLVPSPSTAILAARALLAQVLILAVLVALWAVARTLCGEPLGVGAGQWKRVWSFRGRLTMALFAFFLLPMAAFGGTAFRALSREVVRTAEAVAERGLAQAVAEVQGSTLAEVSQHVGIDLLLYHDGVLAEAASPEVIDLGLYHTWLAPPTYLAFAIQEAVEGREERRLAGQPYLVAYRRLAAADVLASPTPLAAGEIARRQRELTDVVLLAGLLGAALSVILSLGVGRALSSPIEGMSQAAARVGEGDLSVRLPEDRSDEFGRLFHAFNEMVHGLGESQAELVGEKRRTETIVAQAATGVIALDAAGRVALINPRAGQILGAMPEPGEPIPDDRPLPAAVAHAVRRFLGADFTSATGEWSEEREVEGRVIRLRLRPLPVRSGPPGAVVVLEDVTAEIRSARVLAWGEMARQVAHEIKNPLTPMKLAVQHVRRAYADGRPDFGAILDRNADAVLGEIDRLGEIARAFARFGTPAETAAEVESVDVGHVADETLALYRGGGDEEVRYVLDVPTDAPRVRARVGELKEVLINLLENARGAMDGGGGEIRIAAAPTGGGEWLQLDVGDTGEGIPPELLPRVFEPQFSTKSSGTGLGLAIVRRLVESWGGEVTVDSTPGEGTTVHIRLRVDSQPGE
jgi:signal transduction histidine kinase